MMFVFFGARERPPVVKPHKCQTKTATAQASAKKKKPCSGVDNSGYIHKQRVGIQRSMLEVLFGLRQNKNSPQ